MKQHLCHLQHAFAACALATTVACAQASDWPFIVIRHTSALNAAPADFAAGAPAPASRGFSAGAPAPALVDVSNIEKYPLASRRTKLLDDLDAATGGAFPVRIDECRPLRILPRVREDGRLDSVTILNLSIGGTDELKVRIRRPVSRRALLQGPKMAAPAPISCASGAAPDEAVITLPDIPGWQIVTLFFGEDGDGPDRRFPPSCPQW